jgi:hypothetical protein
MQLLQLMCLLWLQEIKVREQHHQLWLQETKIKNICDIENCAGSTDSQVVVCLLCEADIHESYFMDQTWKLKEYPVGCHNQVFCSIICCLWHVKEKIVVADVRKERLELTKLLKKQLVEMAKASKVRVTQCR